MDGVDRDGLAIFLMGRTGAGKTSISWMLEQRFGFHAIRGGQLLRALASRDGPDADLARRAVAVGGTLPDDIIHKLYDSELRAIPNPLKCIDGNPRSLEHFQSLCLLLGSHGYAGSRLLYLCLDIDRYEADSRLAIRRLCPRCGTHTTEALCGLCCTPTEQRRDDSSAAVRNEKNRWFDEDVGPVVDYLRSSSALVHVDASQPLDHVFGDVRRALLDRLMLLGLAPSI